MQLICLGSSSKGNSYILRASNGEALILECGVSFKDVAKSLNHDISKVVGALPSHVHGDHFGKAVDFFKNGIDVFIEMDNQDKLVTVVNHRLKFYKKGEILILGNFKIKAFKVVHDVPTVGYLIQHPEMGKMVFITDTKYCEYVFSGIDHYLVEANYSLDIMNERLISGSLQGYLKNRIMESHMDLQTCKEFLQAQDLSECKNVILLHLSDSNSDEDRFIKEVKEVTGKPVFVADKGREFNLSIDPF